MDLCVDVEDLELSNMVLGILIFPLTLTPRCRNVLKVSSKLVLTVFNEKVLCRCEITWLLVLDFLF